MPRLRVQQVSALPQLCRLPLQLGRLVPEPIGRCFVSQPLLVVALSTQQHGAGTDAMLVQAAGGELGAPSAGVVPIALARALTWLAWRPGGAVGVGSYGATGQLHTSTTERPRSGLAAVRSWATPALAMNSTFIAASG